MKKEHILGLLLAVLAFIFVFSISLPFFPQASANISFAENYTATVVTRVNVSNSPPFVSNLTIITPINLVPNSTFNLSCNATVLDYNNWSDIALVNVTFFSTNISKNHFRDTNRSHYSAWNCTNSVEINSFERLYNCWVPVAYNAFFSNWTCNITATDQLSATDSETITTTVNDLISFAVPDTLDFGNVPVLNTSLNFHLNETNIGNQLLNFSAFAYGSVEGDNTVMICEYGNITNGTLFYSNNITDVNYPIPLTNMTRVSNTNATSSPLGVIAHPFNETGPTGINGTTWRLTVPVGPGGTPSGICNGTLIIRAQKYANSVS